MGFVAKSQELQYFSFQIVFRKIKDQICQKKKKKILFSNPFCPNMSNNWPSFKILKQSNLI